MVVLPWEKVCSFQSLASSALLLARQDALYPEPQEMDICL